VSKNSLTAKEIVFVVPTYNEEKVLDKTITPLLQIGEVILVDDGSELPVDISLPTFGQIHYIRHYINRGQGAAIETGFKYVRKNMPQVKYIVTYDADGQHDVLDAIEMLKIAKTKYDVVLGSRFLSKKNSVPLFKRKILQGFAATYSFLNGKKITDRHFGLRVLSRKFIQENSLMMSGFEHADEILDLIIKGNWNYFEYPCSVTYTDYSKSKGQPLINGLNILFNKVFKKL
jgi:glycosyltransferase involved in cell wall biosynthesis